MSLDNRRVWLAGGLIAAVLVIAASWFLLISPEFSSADDQRSSAQSTTAQNLVLEQKLKVLQEKSTQLGSYSTQLRNALQALPYDSGLPAFTRQLTQQAKESNVTVSAVTVGGLAPVAAVAAAPTSATGDTTTSSAPAPATPTPTPTPTPTDGSTPAVTASGGLYSVQVTIKSTGPMAAQVAFLKRIQNEGPRRALVTSSQIGSGPTGGSALDKSSTFTTQVTVFSSPLTPDQVAALQQLASGKIGS